MVQHHGYFIISVILLLVVAGYACNRVVFLQTARRVEGKIISVIGRDSSCGMGKARHNCTKFNAVAQYRTPETGRDYTVELSAGRAYGHFQPTDKARLHRGEAIRIAYDPARPEKSFEDTFFGIWGTPLTIGFFQLVAFFNSFGETRRRRSIHGI